MSGDCDRARQWASTELDGELSTFERVLLRAHLAGCPPCREFRTAIGGMTDRLRAAPLEAYSSTIDLRRMRRRPHLRLAPAAAAVAVAAVGLGSILASSALRSGPVAAGGDERVASSVTSRLASVDTMNLRTSNALERMNAFQQLRIAPAQRSLRGGPVLLER